MQNSRVPEEWKQMLDVVRKFTAREIAPRALEADQGADQAFIAEIAAQLSDIGILGAIVPEEWGGSGMAALGAALILDTVSGGCPSVATALAYHFAAQAALIEAGSEKQKRQWLQAPDAALAGTQGICTCIFPDAEAPCKDDTATLALENHGEGVMLEGTSGFVVGAGMCSWFVVFARPRGDPADGPVTCLVISSDRNGVTLAEEESFGGLKALPIRKVRFRRVAISAEDILGHVQKHPLVLDHTRALLHAFIGAVAMGLARSAYDKARSYACERYQYGKILARHQTIQRMLGAMLTSLNAGTALYIQTLAGESIEGIFASGRGDYAKIHCTDAAVAIAIDAVQIHGGYGYMQDYGVERLMRDAKILSLLEGANPVLQIHAVCRELERSALENV